MYTLCVELFFSHINFTIVIRVIEARSLCFLLFFEYMYFWQQTVRAGPERLPQERIRFTDGTNEGAAGSSSGGSDELPGEP